METHGDHFCRLFVCLSIGPLNRSPSVRPSACLSVYVHSFISLSARHTLCFFSRAGDTYSLGHACYLKLNFVRSTLYGQKHKQNGTRAGTERGGEGLGRGEEDRKSRRERATVINSSHYGMVLINTFCSLPRLTCFAATLIEGHIYLLKYNYLKENKP